jgi:hypothetical protein
LRQHRLPQKVAQIVGQHEQLQSHMVVHKFVNSKGSPVQIGITWRYAYHSRNQCVFHGRDTIR